MVGPLSAAAVAPAAFAGIGVGIVGYNAANARYPTLIRIAGALNTTEATGVTKLVLFFQNLAPYQVNANNDGSSICTGSSGTTALALTCVYYPGTVSATAAVGATALPSEILMQPRLELTWSSVFNTNSQFQVLIPVHLVVATPSLYLAVMDSTTAAPLYITKDSTPYFVNTAVTTTATPVAASIARIVPASTVLTGSVGTYPFKIGNTDSANYVSGSVNTYSGTMIVNAGLQYCANYNFMAASGASITNSKSGSTTFDEKCLSYNLNLAATLTAGVKVNTASDTWCTFCPIGTWVTLTGSQEVASVVNFTLWNKGNSWVRLGTPVTSPTYGCLLINTGAALYCDDAQEVITPNVITGLSLSPSTMTTTSSNIKLVISFTMFNPLPTGSAITSAIYLRLSAATLWTQEAGAACRIAFGANADQSCVFTPSFTPAAAGTGSDNNELTVAVNPALINGFTPTADKSVVVTLYGIKTTLTAATTSTVIASTRSISGTTFNSQIDVSPASPAVNFGVTVGTAAASPTLLSAGFLFTQRGARSTFMVAFNPSGSRDIFRGEKFFISWNSNTAFTTTVNAAASLLCEVYDSKTSEFLPLFKTCLVDSTGITLTAQDQKDISISTFSPVVYLRGFTSVDAGTANLSAALYAVGGSTIIQPIATTGLTIQPASTVNVNTTIFGSSDITLTRLANVVGATSELNFAIKNVAGYIINNGWRLVIDFPIYYSPRLSNIRNIACLVNNVTTNCMLSDHRQLTIVVGSPPIAINATFNVRIVGISNTKFTTAGTFWVGLDNDMNSNWFNVSGTVTDPAVAAEPTASIWLYNTTIAVASAEVRTAVTWTWMLIPKAAIANGSYFTIAFPDSWIGTLTSAVAGGVNCMLTQGQFNSSFGQNASANGNWWYSYGNRIKLSVTQAINASSQLNVTCTNFRLPDMLPAGGCFAETPQFIATDANESVVIAISTAASTHLSRMWMITSPSLIDLVVMQTMPNTPMNVLQGTTTGIQNSLMVSPPTGPFTKIVTFTQSPVNPNVTIFPASPMAQVGDAGLLIRFQISQNAPLGPQTVLLMKSESVLSGQNTNSYAQPAAIKVMVMNTPVRITAPPSFMVPVGGKSVPVMYNLDYVPQSEITINFAVNDSSVSVAPASVVVAPPQMWTPAANMVSVVVSMPSTATVGANFLLIISSITGANAASYLPALNNASQVTAGPAQTDSPTVSIGLDSATSSATTQGLLLTIGTTNATAQSVGQIPPVTVFWNCMFKNAGFVRDLAFVQAKAMAPPMMNASDPNGELFGTFAVNAPTIAPITAKINMLRASTAYWCKVWVVNQVGNNASNWTNFTTTTNGGKVARINVNFDASKYVATIRQSVLCWFVQNFAVNAMQVRSINNEMCGSAMMSPLMYNKTIALENNVTGMQIPFFFYPNLMNNQDSLYTTVVSNVQSAAWIASFKSATAQNVVSVWNATTPNATTPILTGAVVTNTTTGATVTGYTLNLPGFIYMVLLSNTSSMPTPVELMKGTNAMSSAIVYFDGQMYSQSNVTFGNFSSGMTYQLYWASSCEDPSEMGGMCLSTIYTATVGQGSAVTTSTSNNGGSGTTNACVINFGLTLFVAVIVAMFN